MNVDGPSCVNTFTTCRTWSAAIIFRRVVVHLMLYRTLGLQAAPQWLLIALLRYISVMRIGCGAHEGRLYSSGHPDVQP